MTLFINTASFEDIILEFKDVNNNKLKTHAFKAPRQQAEKLLPAISKMLIATKKSLQDIKKIEVVVRGGSFTSLRIGVVTANALGYAMKIPVEAVEASGQKITDGLDKIFSTYNIAVPRYDKEPNIGVKKKK